MRQTSHLTKWMAASAADDDQGDRPVGPSKETATHGRPPLRSSRPGRHDAWLPPLDLRRSRRCLGRDRPDGARGTRRRPSSPPSSSEARPRPVPQSHRSGGLSRNRRLHRLRDGGGQSLSDQPLRGQRCRVFLPAYERRHERLRSPAKRDHVRRPASLQDLQSVWEGPRLRPKLLQWRRLPLFSALQQHDRDEDGEPGAGRRAILDAEAVTTAAAPAAGRRAVCPHRAAVTWRRNPASRPVPAGVRFCRIPGPPVTRLVMLRHNSATARVIGRLWRGA
jgi:hypothetical protein